MLHSYPDFLIIGAAKAGSTSLHSYLSQHPSVFFAPIKEPHYFSSDIKVQDFNERYYKNSVIDLEKYFEQKPLKEIFLAFLEKEEHYAQLFKEAEAGQISGEASTSYLYSNKAAENIKKHNPNTKLIALLRNPVERAYSHYRMALKYGFTSLPLRHAIEQDQKKEIKGWGISELFIELGLYADQLERVYQHFSKDQVLLMKSEDLKNNKAEALKKISSFLALKPFRYKLEKEHNKGGEPRFKKLNELLNKAGLRNSLAQMLPEELKEFLRKLYLKEKGTEKLNEEDRRWLYSFYEKDIKKTEDLTGLDLSDWKIKSPHQN